MDELLRSQVAQLLRKLNAVRTDTLRSKAAAEELSRLTPPEAVAVLAALLRLRRDSSEAAVVIDAVSRALAKQELEQEFLESVRTCAQSRAERLVEALLASGPALREYDHNAEAFIDRRLRAMTLGERRALSRARDIDMLVRLAHDQDVRVIQGVLQNPRLTEREAVLIASRRPTHAHILEAVLASRFGHSRRVRRAIAHNPYSPVALAARAMATLTAPELEALAEDERIPADVRQHARSLIVGKRPTPAERAGTGQVTREDDAQLLAWLSEQAAESQLELDSVEWVSLTDKG